MIDPVPRGRRPDVLFATPWGPVVSRISMSLRAIPSSAASQVTGSNTLPGSPFLPRTRLSGVLMRRGL